MRSITSPDSKWTAYFFDFDYYHYQLTITDQAGVVVRQIYEPKPVMDETRLSPAFWSRDNKYLFFKVMPAMDGEGFFMDAGALMRLSMDSGEVKLILAADQAEIQDWTAVEYWPPITYSVSPDLSKLAYAYSVEDGARVAVRNLLTDEVKVQAIPNEDACNIVWSPDSQHLLLTAIDWVSDEVRLYSILEFHLPSLKYDVIRKDDPRFLVVSAWDGGNKATVYSFDEEYTYTIRLSTGKLSEGPTPELGTERSE
jgi:hypothetical protein